MAEERWDPAFMLLVHRAIIRDLDRIAQTLYDGVEAGLEFVVDPELMPGAPRARAIAQWWTFLSDLFRHHSHVEDDVLWPAVRAKADEFDAETVDELQATHESMDRLLSRTDKEFAALGDGTGDPATITALAVDVTALRAEFAQHIVLEENAGLYLVAQYVDAETGRRFEIEHRRTPGGERGENLFPWLAEGASYLEQERIWSSLPEAARLMVRERWTLAYLDKTRAAFGAY